MSSATVQRHITGPVSLWTALQIAQFNLVQQRESVQLVHLDRNDRKAILNSIRALVPAKHINVTNPHQDYASWLALLDARRLALESAENVEEFETAVRELLSALGTSHTAFFRIGQGVPPVHAIHATL